MVNLFLTYSVFWGAEKVGVANAFVECNCSIAIVKKCLLEKHNEYAVKNGKIKGDNLIITFMSILDSAVADVLSDNYYKLTIEK